MLRETDPWLFMLEGQLFSIVTLMACMHSRLFEQYFQDMEAEGLEAYSTARRFVDSGRTSFLASKNRNCILLTLAQKNDTISVVCREWSMDCPGAMRRYVYILKPDSIQKSVVTPGVSYIPQYHPEFTAPLPRLRPAVVKTHELKSLLQLLGDFSLQPTFAARTLPS